MTLQELLSRAKELSEGATPGEWTVETRLTSIGRCHVIQPFKGCVYEDSIFDLNLESEKSNTAAFIAFARSALPLLVKIVEAQKEALEEVSAPLGVPLSLVQGDIRQACKDLNQEREDKRVAAAAALSECEKLAKEFP